MSNNNSAERLANILVKLTNKEKIVANAEAIVKELRFVIEDELTQVYVAIEARGDSPIGVQGWHHKTFPASKNVIEILESVAAGDDWLLWGLEAP